MVGGRRRARLERRRHLDRGHDGGLLGEAVDDVRGRVGGVLGGDDAVQLLFCDGGVGGGGRDEAGRWLHPGSGGGGRSGGKVALVEGEALHREGGWEREREGGRGKGEERRNPGGRRWERGIRALEEEEGGRDRVCSRVCSRECSDSGCGGL